MNNLSEIKKANMELGEWVLERVIGSGTFGKVILFQNKTNGEKIAVKKCHNETSVNSELWEQEIKIFHNLNHPGTYLLTTHSTLFCTVSKTNYEKLW